MENGIKVFEQAGLGSVRVVMQGDEPWFVAKDVCCVLGIEWKGSATMGPLDDDDEKGITTNDTPNDAVNTHCKKVNKFSYGDMTQGAQPYNIIPESDVYRLIMRSNLKNEDVERF